MRLHEISQYEWVHWYRLNKKKGIETLEYDRIHFDIAPDSENELQITKDTKVIVFRFNTPEKTDGGRIIGLRINSCATLHILGYDFDFSAYRH